MSKSALVVDDSKSARFALRKYLETHAYQVDVAENAEQAFTYLKDHRPEVIFLDQVMPGIDGFEALRTIKSDPRTVTIPVVICSSNEGEDFLQQARTRGAVDVLPKPPSPDQLGRVLANLQQLAETLRASSAAKPTSKVQPLRQPDETIERAVMSAVRQSLPEPLPVQAAPPPPPPPVYAPPPQAAAPPPAPAYAPPPMAAPPPPARAPAYDAGAGSRTGSYDVSTGREVGARTGSYDTGGSDKLAAMREQVDAKLRKLTQDMYSEFGSIKASLANLEAPQGLSSGQREAVQDLLQDQFESFRAPIDRAIEEVRATLDQFARGMDHSQKQLLETARRIAQEEAHSISERTVMSAAARISEQLADAISRALRPR